MDAVLLAAFQRKFNTVSKALAPVLYKLYFGLPVKITFLGDSVLEGTTVTSGGGTLGVDDCISLVGAKLGAQWPNATVTVVNRAHSGTTQAWENKWEWANALADNADLYVISGGKNDLAAYTLASPLSLMGQTYDSSVGMIEAKVAELRNVKPDACIAIMSDNPYATTSTTQNGYQSKWNAAAERVAYAYGCEYIDSFRAFTALGTWDSLLSDGVHPNGASGGNINATSGHALLARTVMAHFPANWTPKSGSDQGGSFLRPAVPGSSRLYTPWGHSRAGLATMYAQTTVAYTPKLFGPSGWTGTGPYTSTTAGSFMHATLNGSEAFLDLVLGAGQGIVDILIDGTPTYTSLDLSTFTNGKPLHLPAMGPGWHYVTVKVISGSVTYNGVWSTQGRAQFVNYDAPSVTMSGMGTPGSGVGSDPGPGTYVPSAVSGTQTITFVGTGIAMHSWRLAGGGGTAFFSSATIDGVALTTPRPINSGSDYQYMRHVIASGLTYGKHVLTVTWSAVGINVTGFDVIDEQATLRPAQLQGWAGAAEVVKFGQVFPGSAPVVTAKDPAAGLTFSSVTQSGFTMGATAGWWVASAADDSAGNRLLY